MRVLLPALSICLLVCAVAVFWASFFFFRGEELEQARARLSLYRSTVEAELQRFAHLPYVLAQDPFVIETAEGGSTAALNARLESFAAQAGIDAIYLMDTNGLTIAASNSGTQASFVGQAYGYRPYFRAAAKGEQGAFYGIGATTGIPGYFFANPVLNDGGDTVGVIAIKIDLSELQDSWQEAGERVILTNADGVALLASSPAWRYRTLQPLTTAQRETIAAARQFGNEPLEPLAWSVKASNAATLDGETYLYLRSDGFPDAWALHYFATEGQARASAWLVTSALILIAGFAFIVFQVQRTRQIRFALARSEEEEAALRAANARLAVEIDERRAAEQRLQKTQAELERAGRLAALGQLASSVTHELGQPIAAMRNQIAAAEITATPTTLTQKLHQLVDRMEGITRQLKFFSRKGRDQFETFDLADAMRSVLELMAPNIQNDAVDIRVATSETPVTFHGNRLRIEQVMTNLIRNAMDAMEGCDTRRIDIDIGADDTQTWFQVSDTGHGLEGQTLSDLREPFATTRESGQGMGLGLTISAGIVDDHGGEMTANPAPGGGAVFRATFPRNSEGHAI
ncbi:ATP-binding protein [uncultured Tateyamaria sp.]|uniref:sensor histidine kinase n=1 Tax=uncultured Tateyamaria sp. TaxID=455651 RepID=UPI002610D19F|nr:ATP-binding protein [uncultured Tateyamaria sp.]